MGPRKGPPGGSRKGPLGKPGCGIACRGPRSSDGAHHQLLDRMEVPSGLQFFERLSGVGLCLAAAVAAAAAGSSSVSRSVSMGNQ